jgi:flagellar protein FlaG
MNLTIGTSAPAPVVKPTTAAARPMPDLMERASQNMAVELSELVAHTGLQFRVDQDTDRVVVSIIDRESGEILRQVPSEEALRVARSIARNGRGLLDQLV